VGGVPFSDPEIIDGLSQGIRELIAIVGMTLFMLL
jgi:hypothetical protein